MTPASRRREAGRRTPDSGDTEFPDVTAARNGQRSRWAETPASAWSLLALSGTSLLANAYGRRK